MPFEFTRLAIPDVMLIQPAIFNDERGFFLETYKYSDFARAGMPEHFVQDNYSKSKKGSLRGLHYQKNPKAQGKLVRCVRGSILDIAVDMRKGSPHYAQWVGVELSEENNALLYIPEGFAHGFQVLSEAAEVLYKCTEEYSPEHDRGVRWNDPDLHIAWPMNSPVLSEKDRGLPLLADAENNFAV